MLLMSDTFAVKPVEEPDRQMDDHAHDVLSSLGFLPMRVVYGNIDAQAPKGLVDPRVVGDYVEDCYGADASGNILLDYEIPHMGNLKLGMHDPLDPAYLATMGSMCAAIPLLKARFPLARFSYYGIPGLPYYLDAGKSIDWSHAEDSVKDLEIGHRNDAYAPLYLAVDYLSPSIYDQHAAAKSPDANSLKHTTETYRQRITALCRMANDWLVANGHAAKPVIPAMSCFFAPGGNTQENLPIPVDEIVSDQVATALAAGVDGLGIWSAIDYYIRTAATNTYADPNTSGQKKWRDFFASQPAWLNGATPTDWADPAVRTNLLRIAGVQVADAATAVHKAVVRWARAGVTT